MDIAEVFKPLPQSEPKLSQFLCIYHANCADGASAAWVVRNHYPPGAVEVYAASHGGKIEYPDVMNRNVIFVDFAYKRETMIEIASKAFDVTVLDHHKSAEEDLSGLSDVCSNVKLFFDQSRSGVGVAWEYFYGSMKPMPQLFKYVQDRDLWTWKLGWTKEICLALDLRGYDLNRIGQLIGEGDEALDRMAIQGELLSDKQDNDIERMLKNNRRRMIIGGYIIPVANIPSMYASEAGSELAKGQTFAATYVDSIHGRNFSLRSDPKGLDVSIIASAYGGGGHFHAAGFQMEHGWEGEAFDRCGYCIITYNGVKI